MDNIRASVSLADSKNYHDLSGLQTIKQSANEDEALKKVAEQFESLFVHELLKNMRKANEVFEQDSLFSSSESKMFRDMYDQQLSQELSGRRGLGLSEVLYQQLSREYGNNTQAHSGGDLVAPDRKQNDVSSVASTARDIPVAVQNTASNNRALEEGISDSSPQEKTEFSSPQEFVETILPMAKQAAKALGLNPLVLVAQAALETGWGQHILSSAGGGQSYNLFNIKADASWQGATTQKNVLEYRDGVAVKEVSRFRSYESFAHSFQDFLDFITKNPRYENAINSTHSEDQFVVALQDAGYATDPQYAQKILSVLNRIQNGPFAAETLAE